MSTASDKLKAIGVHNPYGASDYARDRGGVGVYLSRRPEERGRSYLSAAWQVVRPGFMTDPDTHWRNHNLKTFSIGFKLTENEAEAEAMTWASQRYGVDKWVKVPGLGRCWFPEADAALIKRALREAGA